MAEVFLVRPMTHKVHCWIPKKTVDGPEQPIWLCRCARVFVGSEKAINHVREAMNHRESVCP